MRAPLLVVALVLAPGPALASELTPEQAARYHALTQELRCLVCQNQSIADSNAPLAEDLRHQVRDQIAGGRSDREIAEFMTARYGDFVLYRPPMRVRTVLLWLGPFLLLAAAAVTAAAIIRRSRPAAAAPDAAAVSRILDGGDPR